MKASIEKDRAQSIAEIRELDNDTAVVLQGRITNVRVTAKSIFTDVSDSTGKIQLCVERENPSQNESPYEIGNIVDVCGTLGNTRRGEKTIFVKSVSVVATCTRPIGAKALHLASTDARHRNRVADYVQHPVILKYIADAARLKQAFRELLFKEGFLELDTGILQTRFDAGLARPFQTHGHALEKDLFLRLTAELRLKMMITAGLPKVFELGPSFRNEGINHQYNPEFTLLEAYVANGDGTALTEVFATWTQLAMLQVYGSTTVTNDEHEINFGDTWARIPFFSVLSALTGRTITAETPHAEMAEVLSTTRTGEYTASMPPATLFLKAANKLIAPTIVNPIYITDMPSAACSPFVAQTPDNPLIARSAWLFIDGMVIGDFYDDDNDPDSLGRKLAQQAEQTGATLNRDFLDNLAFGMPTTAGMGVGFNRLMLAMRPQGVAKDIKETMPFPLF